MAESVLTLFRRQALRLGERPCFHYKEQGSWKKISWVDAEEMVRRMSLGLHALGLKKGATVALLSQTRYEWTLLDLAILSNQAVTVPIYPSLAADPIAYILKDSKSSFLIVENASQWERIQSHLEGWSGPIILIEGKKEGLISLSELQERGKKLVVNLYDDNLRQIRSTDTATIVYTSGTTGPPKGAILTHENLQAEVQGLEAVFPFNPEHIGLMCLPLAHVIARAMQFFQFALGFQQAYAESLERLPENLKEIRPHFMAAVPRLLEKSYEKIFERVQHLPFPLRKLFTFGFRLGMKVSELRQKGLYPTFSQAFFLELANLFLFRKVRKGFGGRLRLIISGGAPLGKEMAQFFHRIGILVLEGYGLTETFAAVTINRLDDYRFGTVGKPLEGVRMKVAEDQEICVKGDNVFVGYLGLKEATIDAFDKEGWFRTGDIGEFTKDGFLRVTDRKKDIIVTSAGKKISPQNVEGLLGQSPYIQQVVVHGDKRKFLSALVTLHWEKIEAFAQKEGIVYPSREVLISNPKIQKLIQQEIDQCNQKLSSFETIKKFAILPHNFKVETGELTPTLKVKRKVVAEKYKTILDSFYVDS